jgi:serine/threonine protein kinase
MIQKYLRAYSNPDLAKNVAKCVEDVFMQYQYRTSVEIHNWEKKLELIAKSPDLMRTIFNDLYMGSGTYAFVLRKSQSYIYKEVMKISLGKREGFDPMWKSEMPFEYCVGLLSPTSHILRPIENSFQPIELPEVLFNSYVFTKEKKRISFYEPAVNGWDRTPSVVPMFEMPECQHIVWTNFSAFNPSVKFIEVLHALNDIHKSGISLNDISEQNMMSCNGEWKFIDLGFATLYDLTTEYLKDIDKFLFGNHNYRSPWADIISHVSMDTAKKHTNWNLREKFELELIANDYWSLALLFGIKFCNFRKIHKFKLFKNHIKSIIFEKNKFFINRSLQEDVDSIFMALKDLGKERSWCLQPFQECLIIILEKVVNTMIFLFLNLLKP